LCKIFRTQIVRLVLQWDRFHLSYRVAPHEAARKVNSSKSTNQVGGKNHAERTGD